MIIMIIIIIIPAIEIIVIVIAITKIKVIKKILKVVIRTGEWKKVVNLLVTLWLCSNVIVLTNQLKFSVNYRMRI